MDRESKQSLKYLFGFANKQIKVTPINALSWYVLKIELRNDDNFCG